VNDLYFTYDGPRELVATERVHQDMVLTLTCPDGLPVGARARVVLGRFRSLKDNNDTPHWRLHEIRLVGGGAITESAAPPMAFHQMGAARLAEPFNHYVMAGVTVTEALAAGAVVIIALAGLLTHHAPIEARLLLQVAQPESDLFTTIGNVVELAGVPGAATGLEARLKAQPAADGVAAMTVFTTDAVTNPVDTGLAADRLAASATGGTVVATGVCPSGADPVRVRVTDRRSGMSALSNPSRRPAAGRWPVYFGGMHWHTRFSGDGDRELAQALTYARDVVNLDVAAVTDHTPTHAWRETCIVNEQFHEPGRFVTIPAWEWSTTTGHSNIYLRTPDVPAAPGNRPPGRHPGLADWPDDAVVVPHHTNIRSTMRRADGSHYWHPFDWSLPNRRVRLVEVVQGRGNFEADIEDADWGIVTGGLGASVQDALAMGYRMGFIGGTDNHSGFPTRDPKLDGCYIGMAAFLAPALTREAIWQAMDARRTYATSGVPILCDWQVNGLDMGAEGRWQPGTDVRFSATLNGTAAIRVIEVISERQVVWQRAVDALDVSLVDECLPAPTGDSAWYYLRLRQEDGHRAWLSPIWLDRA
jgi:hypothetical protein